jgi:AcrR family transcriptional regulator
MLLSLPARSRRRRKEARPSELIEAAIDLFAERGYAATRLEDVARRAGVSKGTAYLYFPNKEALFKAAVREVLISNIAMGERDVEEWRGPSEALLRSMLEHWSDVIRSRRGAVIKLIVAEARNFPELAGWYHEEVAARGQRLIGAVLRRGMLSGEFRPLDIEATAEAIACPVALRAIWAHSLACRDASSVAEDKFLATYLEIMLTGLRSTSPCRPAAMAGAAPTEA